MTREPLEVAVEVRERDFGPIAWVTPDGDVDLANAEELAEALGSSQVTESSGVVVDLRRVPFMDSSGLSAVLQAANELDQRLVVIAEEGTAVARLFDLTNVNEVLHAVTSEEAAEAAIEATDLDAA